MLKNQAITLHTSTITVLLSYNGVVNSAQGPSPGGWGRFGLVFLNNTTEEVVNISYYVSLFQHKNGIIINRLQ